MFCRVLGLAFRVWGLCFVGFRVSRVYRVLGLGLCAVGKGCGGRGV